MSALMRISRLASFAQHITKVSRLNNTVTQRQSIGHEYFQKISKCLYGTRPAPDTRNEEYFTNDVDRITNVMKTKIRKYARLSRADVESVLNEVKNHESISKHSSLIILRMLGSYMHDERPAVRSQMVEEVWNILKNKVEFDETHYNALLKVHTENELNFSPSTLLSDMEAQNILPNRLTFQRMIAMYCQNGDIDSAMKILDHMKEINFPVNDHIFGSFITGYFKMGDVENAENILNVMKEAGLESTVDTYCALMNGYASTGDFDNIKKTLKKAEAEEILFFSQHLLQVLYILVRSGHHEHLDEMIELQKRDFWYNKSAVKYINQLIAHDHDEIAFKVFLSMNPVHNDDDRENTSGRFLLRAWAKFKRPVSLISGYIKEMRNNNQFRDDLSAVAQLAYLGKNTDYGLEVIKEMKDEGMPIRCHYYWPAFCQFKDAKNVEGVLSTVTTMIDQCDNKDELDVTTIMYVIPALYELGMEHQEIRRRLIDSGCTEQDVNFGIFYYISKNSGLSDAIEYAEGKPMNISRGLLRTALLYNLTRYADESTVMNVCKVFEICSQGQSAYFFASVLTPVLIEIFRIHKKQPMVSTINNVLERIQDRNLKATGNLMANVKQLNVFLSPDILKKLATISRMNTQGVLTSYGNLNLEELQKRVEGETDNTVLVNRYLEELYKTQNVEEYEKCVADMDAKGQKTQFNQLRQLAQLHLQQSHNLEKAKHYINRMETEYPDFTRYNVVLLNKAKVEIELGLEEDAVNTIKASVAKHSEKGQSEGNLFRFLPHVKDIVQASANKAPETGQMITKLLQEVGYIAQEQMTDISEAYMDGILQRDNQDDLITGVDFTVKLFGQVGRMNKVFCLFINNNDPERLQKVVDVATEIYGKRAVLHHLLINFVRCKHVAKARQILRTPGLQAVMPILTSSCRQMFNDGQIDRVEELVEITQDLPGVDRDEMLFELIHGYCRQSDYKKAQNVLTMYEDEVVRARPRTLRYLAKALKNQNMDVTFDVPENPLSEFKSAILAENWTVAHQYMKQMTLFNVEKILEELGLENSYRIRSFFKFLKTEDHTFDLLQKLEVRGNVPQMTTLTLKKAVFHSCVLAGNEKWDAMHNTITTDLNKLPHYLSYEAMSCLADKSPDNFKALDVLIHRHSDDHPSNIPLSSLWSHYFIQESPESDRILELYPDLWKKFSSKEICDTAVQSNKPQLITKLIDVLKAKNPLGLHAVYKHLICSHGSDERKHELPSLVKQAQEEGVLKRVCMNRDVQHILRRENIPIPENLSETQ